MIAGATPSRGTTRRGTTASMSPTSTSSGPLCCGPQPNLALTKLTKVAFSARLPSQTRPKASAAARSSDGPRVSKSSFASDPNGLQSARFTRFALRSLGVVDSGVTNNARKAFSACSAAATYMGRRALPPLDSRPETGKPTQNAPPVLRPWNRPSAAAWAPPPAAAVASAT